MRRLIVTIIVAAAMSACGGGEQPVAEQEPPPTFTPLPTYTALPTFTPLPEPSATATFLPSPSPLPDEGTTEGDATTEPGSEVTATATAGAPTPGSTTQSSVAFDSNMREGPGTEYASITLLTAGEPVTIIGRDTSGLWLYVEASNGSAGWVRITQFTGQIDAVSIPLAQEALDLLVTITPEGTPEPTSTPEGTAEATSPTTFNLVAGGAEVCNTITWGAPAPFELEDPDTEFIPFNFSGTGAEQPAFFIERSRIVDFVELSTEGNLTANCSDDNLCNTVTFTLCAQAISDAPTGGFEYTDPITLEVGNQGFDTMYAYFTTQIPLTITVSDE